MTGFLKPEKLGLRSWRLSGSPKRGEDVDRANHFVGFVKNEKVDGEDERGKDRSEGEVGMFEDEESFRFGAIGA